MMKKNELHCSCSISSKSVCKTWLKWSEHWALWAFSMHGTCLHSRRQTDTSEIRFYLIYSHFHFHFGYTERHIHFVLKFHSKNNCQSLHNFYSIRIWMKRSADRQIGRSTDRHIGRSFSVWCSCEMINFIVKQRMDRGEEGRGSEVFLYVHCAHRLYCISNYREKNKKKKELLAPGNDHKQSSVTRI